MLRRSVINLIGWYGVTAILLAYILITISFIQVTHPLYQLLNITGAGALAFETYKRKDRQPMILNLIWMSIGLLAFFRGFFS